MKGKQKIFRFGLTPMKRIILNNEGGHSTSSTPHAYTMASGTAEDMDRNLLTTLFIIAWFSINLNKCIKRKMSRLHWKGTRNVLMV